LGSAQHHYIIATIAITPPWSQGHFDERLAVLPHYHFTEHRHIFEPIQSEGYEGDFLLAHCNKPYKMTPAVLTALAGAMRRIPYSRLLLSKPAQAFTNVERNVRRELQSRGTPTGPESSPAGPRGPGSARRGLLWKSRHSNKRLHMEAMARADLFVDTLQVNAVWTAFDSLWAGVPTATIPGGRMASRIGASIVGSAHGAGVVRASMKAMEDAIAGLGTG